MNYLRNLFLILTGLGAVISFYLKVSKDFIGELIKTKYKNIPGKQGIFEIVTIYAMFSIFAIDAIMLPASIIDAFENGVNLTASTSNANIFFIIFAYFIAIIIFNAVLGPIFIYSKVKKEFINKLQNREMKKISKIIIRWNDVSSYIQILISTACFIYIAYICAKQINIDKFENNFIFLSSIDVLTMRAIIIVAIIAFICITSFIIERSLKEIIKAINDNYIYEFEIETGPIKCGVFLEYNEYYLLFENNTEKYINKSKVKNIVKKSLDEEKGDEVNKISIYDKAINQIFDLKKYEEYKKIKDKIKAKYSDMNCERDIELEIERIEENIEIVKAPIESYIFVIMSIIIPSLIIIWTSSLNKDDKFNHIILIVTFLYLIVTGLVFIKKISNNDKHFQILIMYRKVLQDIKNDRNLEV